MDNHLQYHDSTLQTGNNTVKALYDRYAGMLLGYIFNVVKDEKLAEQYLIDTFKEVPKQLADFTDGFNAYCKLQLLARNKLVTFFNTNTGNGAATNSHTNQFIKKMSPEQQSVFCGLHYCGKSVSVLAAELNTNEAVVRKLLKEAFGIIRNNNSNGAGVH